MTDRLPQKGDTVRIEIEGVVRAIDNNWMELEGNRSYISTKTESIDIIKFRSRNFKDGTVLSVKGTDRTRHRLGGKWLNSVDGQHTGSTDEDYAQWIKDGDFSVITGGLE